MSKARDLAQEPNQVTNRKNMVYNGAMTVAQRGTSEASASGYGSVDRWYINEVTDGAVTASQSTEAPDGFANSLKIDVTTADTSLSSGQNFNINQRLEGQDLQHLKKGTSGALPVTISFWVRSNKTGTGVLEVKDSDNTRTINKSFTIDAADTWEKKEITFEGDTTGALDNDNALSVLLVWWLAAGSTYTSGTLATSWEAQTNANRAVGVFNIMDSTSNEFYITGVQMEVGEVATEFEHRSYGEELQLCQRYYEENTVNEYYQLPSASASQVQRQTVGYATPKRASGTITVTRNASASTSGTVVAGYLLGTSSFMVYFTGSQYNVVWYDWKIDAEL